MVDRTFGMYPSDIDARKTELDINCIAKRISEENLLYPYTSETRTNESKSRLIELLFLRIQLPEIYLLKKRGKDVKYLKNASILEDIIEFIDDSFCLENLEFFKDLNGKKFSEIPCPMQRRIKEAYLIINTIDYNGEDAFEEFISKRI